MKKEAVIKQADNIVSSASSWVIGENWDTKFWSLGIAALIAALQTINWVSWFHLTPILVEFWYTIKCGLSFFIEYLQQ